MQPKKDCATEIYKPEVPGVKLLSSSGLNSRRYFWLIIGYYIISLCMKAVNSQTTNSTIPHLPTSDHHGGVHLFTVDWANISDISIITLWIFCASVAKIAFHMTPKLGHLFPESCLLIVVGIFIGLILYVTNTDIGDNNRLPTNTFFFVMLPPIILDAGYFMPNRLFFGHLGTILIFAVIGTLWNTFAIGITLWGFNQIDLFGMEINALEIFLFSSLISAVDPVAVLAVFEEVHVNDILYIVVFGESLLNDAVTIVLYHTFGALTELGPENITSGEIVKGILSFPIVALGGTVFGIIWGFLIGFATRFTYHVLIIEPVFVFVMAYMAFLSAELFHFSGVLALIFCGITMKNYVQANIAPTSNTTVKYTLKMLSSSSETIIFIFLGVSTINENNVWNWWFVVVTIASCTIYRLLGVFILTAIVNPFRLNKLGFVDQVVMSYGGLRGAVSFALVLLIGDNIVRNDEVRKTMVTTTIAMVYFTVFIQGTTIKPLVEWLRVKRAQTRELTMSERIHERLLENTVITMESILGTVIGHNQIRDKFRQFDSNFIRPLLIRDYKNRQEIKLMETFTNLEMKQAMDDLEKRRTTILLQKAENKKLGVKTQEYEVIPIPPQPPLTPVERQIRQRKLSRKFSSQRNSQDSSKSVFDTNEIFRQIRQRKVSYNRHALDYNDLDDDFNSNYTDSVPFSPVRRAIRKTGIASGTFYRPSSARVSRDELHQTTSLPPNIEISEQDQQQSNRFLVQPVRRTSSTGSRLSPSSGLVAVAGRPGSIAEAPEEALEEIPNSPDTDDVFEE